MNYTLGMKSFLPGPSDEEMEAFRGFIRLMARFRCNMLMLETGGAMEYKRHPEINEGWLEYAAFMNEYSGKPHDLHMQVDWCKNSVHATNGGGRVLPQEKIREIIELCASYGIEIIPEVPCLSHCDYLLTRHPELSERAEDPYPDTACPNHPDYYPLLFDVLEETIELFRPKRINIGHDEYLTIGICPRCQGKSAPEIYAADITKCRDFLAERGVKTMMWCEKLLAAHFLNGAPIGGSRTGVWFKPESKNFTPATYPAIDMVPKDVQMIHWYWSIDRKLELDLAARGFDVIFGNFWGAGIPDWKERSSRPNFHGVFASNWGSPDMKSTQRNGLLFDMAYNAALLENAGKDIDFPALRDRAFGELYELRRQRAGHGRFIEVTHATDENRPAGCYVDGIFVDENADRLGWHLFRDKAGGKIFRAPVIYGTNIVCETISTEQLPPAENAIEDHLNFSRALAGAAWETFPASDGGRTWCRCEYRLPDGFGDVEYAGFEPEKGFAGKVDLAKFEIFER